MEEQPKISLPEGILMMLIVLSADVAEILIDLTGVGIILGEIINFSVGGLIELWLFLKGTKGFWKLASIPIGMIADGIFGSIFPVKTITMALTIFLVNKGEKIAPIAKIAQATKKI